MQKSLFSSQLHYLSVAYIHMAHICRNFWLSCLVEYTLQGHFLQYPTGEQVHILFWRTWEELNRLPFLSGPVFEEGSSPHTERDDSTLGPTT